MERLIAELEVPVEPRREFSQALFARLERELERPVPDWRSFLQVRGPRGRLLFTVAAALVVVVAATLVIAPPGRASAAQTIRQAQQDIAGISQVRAMIHYDINPDGSDPFVARGTTADVEVTYVRGVGYRQQIVGTSGAIPGSTGAGSFIVWDGTYLGSTWSAGGLKVTARDATFDPLRELGWNSPYPNWEGICERGGSELLADATVTGRATRHLRCGDLYGGFWDLWIDRETGFMLKIQGALGRDDYKLGTSAKGGFEVTRIEYTFDVDRSLFVVAEPPGGFPPARARDVPRATVDPYTVTSLRKGEVAPSWSGQLIDGSTFRLDETRGRPLLVLFWADWCPRGDPACDVLRQFDQVSRRYAGRARFVSVNFQGTASEARKIMSQLGYQFPVVDDRVKTISRAWGVDSIPVWVLLDRDGRVVEVRVRPQTVEQLEEMLRGVRL